MDLNTNLQNLQQHCRICLQKGDINIWNHRATLQSEEDEKENSVCMENSLEKSFMQLMDMFNNTQNLLDLTDEFPLTCRQCLDDLKYCHAIYEKIKLANVQLKNLYQQTLDQYIEEEHLIEVEESDTAEVKEIKCSETMEEEALITYSQSNNNDTNQTAALNKINYYKNIPINENDAFVITQFVPETLQVSDKFASNTSKEDDIECQKPALQLLTMNLKAVEVKNLENLESASLPLSSTDVTEPTVYVCQYCPQAFAQSEYLKTHIQNSHVCKFCTQPFHATVDLFKHLREVHTEHKCAICHKLLSSSTNLRHHIKKVHRVNLPAKVTLLDFIKSRDIEETTTEHEVEFLNEIVGPADMDFHSEYLWQTDDCIDVLSESNSNGIN